MPAARKHATLAVASLAVLAAFALAGSAGGVRLSSQEDREAPTAPANVRVTSATPTSVSLAWDASTDNIGVSGYYVYVDAVRARVSGTQYTATNLACGESIGVWVVAFDRRMNRSLSPATTVSTAACPDTQAPTPPSGFRQAATTQEEVVLEWDESSDDVGVVGYGIYRNQLPVELTSEPTVTLTGLVCGSTFEYQVDAVDAAGNRSQRRSAWVQTAPCAELPPLPPPSPSPPPPDGSPTADQTPPSEPMNFLVESATRTSVLLTWSPSTDNVGVSGYRVYVNGTGVLNPTQPGATVTTLTCGAAFTLEVDSADAAGNRSTRARVTASTSACADSQAPTAPTNVVASSRTATSIALAWSVSTDNVGVTGYGLYRGGTLAGNSATTTGIFSGLTCNTNYTLAVDAVDAAGNRSSKTTVMVATTACPDTTAPSSPTGLATSDVTQSSLTLNWNAASDNVGVTGYDVYRDGTKMASVTSTSSAQSGLACATSYSFGVEARDAAGNRSPRAGVNVTMTSCSPSPAPSPSLSVTTNIAEGATLSGSVVWTATPSSTVKEIQFLIDGVKKWVETLAPYQYNGDGVLNISTLANGSHTLTATAVTEGGTTASVTRTVTVQNGTAAPPPSTGALPKLITQGGTYTGSITGDGTGPVVSVRTSDPVIIEDSTVRGVGNANLIDANYAGAQVIVRRTTLEGAPGGVGKAVSGSSFKSIRVENCTILGTWGIRLDAIQAGGTIVVTKNKGRNMVRNPGDPSHFFQAGNHTQQPALIDVSWNEVINTFGQSGIEDVISMWHAGYAKIHDNYIQGAYPDSIGGGYSGSGIMLDSGAHDNEVWNNIVVDTTNAGIGILSGFNNSVHDNRAVFDGRDDAGNIFAAANVGLMVWNYDDNPSWSNNHATNNSVGWVKANGQRNDMWLPDAPAAEYGTNSALPNPISNETEQAEFRNWLGKLAANGVTVGA